jgi:hypothetical protein
MQQLEDLAERLLREGVAYHHVRRYIAELRDHYDDAVRAEIAKGKNADGARAAALDRIGSLDDLAREMISKPELRALSARFPKLWGCVVPIGSWLMICLAVLLTFIAALEARELAGLESGGSPAFAPFQRPADVLLFVVVRAAPVAIGATLLMYALRQRTELFWPLIGIALLAAVAGTADAAIFFSLAPETKSELTFGAGISWEAAARVAVMLALMLAPLALKKRLTPPVA